MASKLPRPGGNGLGDASCGSDDHGGRPARSMAATHRGDPSAGRASPRPMSSEHHWTCLAAHWTRVAVGAPEFRIVREQRAALGLALIVQSLCNHCAITVQSLCNHCASLY
jgi:hypothetical protein